MGTEESDDQKGGRGAGGEPGLIIDFKEVEAGDREGHVGGTTRTGCF